jgi:predicted membrane protein
MSQVEILLSIGLFVFGIALTVIGVLFTRWMNKQETEIEIIKKEINGIKTNYLDRFQSVHNRLQEAEINIIKSIGDLKLDISENYQRKRSAKK